MTPDSVCSGADRRRTADRGRGRRRRPDDVSRRRSLSLGGREAGLQVGQDVVDVLDADGQPDQPRGDTGGQLLGRRELGVGGRRRVDDQRAHVTDVRQVGEQLQRIGERLTGLDAALDLERDDRRRRPSART